MSLKAIIFISFIFSLSYPYCPEKSSILTKNLLFFHLVMIVDHFLLSFYLLNAIIRLFRAFL